MSARWLRSVLLTLGSLGCGEPAAVGLHDVDGDLVPDDVSREDAGASTPNCVWNAPPLATVSETLPPLPTRADNPTTAAGAALGRRLFFDPVLSSTGTVSCGTCHEPVLAFSIDDALTTRGVSGVALERHAPTLVNLAWITQLFWDGGAKNLESLALAPISHPDEMGRTLGMGPILDALAEDVTYVAQFEYAFGPGGLTASHLLRALAQYQRTIVSDQSRWDEVMRGTVDFDLDERRGEELFDIHCARCHTPGLFTDGSFHNNGLDVDFGDAPEGVRRGRGRVTSDPTDIGKFRTPTLRNVRLSAPYMHDGRFTTLREVLEHYRSGMRASPTLDPSFLRADGPPGIQMHDDELDVLERFLDTLTDHGLAARHGAPIKLPDCATVTFP